MKLAIVEISVRDWPAAVGWYRDVLGLPCKLEHAHEGYALFDTGLSLLAVKQHAAAPEPAVLLQFEVADVPAALARLPVKLLKPLKTSPEGYRRAVIQGPEGQPILLFDWQGPATKS